VIVALPTSLVFGVITRLQSGAVPEKTTLALFISKELEEIIVKLELQLKVFSSSKIVTDNDIVELFSEIDWSKILVIEGAVLGVNDEASSSTILSDPNGFIHPIKEKAIVINITILIFLIHAPKSFIILKTNL
jgi:hypothetical protein